MCDKLIMLAVAAALLIVGGAAFEAKATMGTGTESLSARAKSYSPLEKASCSSQGLFCKAGSTLQCNPICVCVPCAPPPPPVRHHKHKS
jgi:hypothetical protein